MNCLGERRVERKYGAVYDGYSQWLFWGGYFTEWRGNDVIHYHPIMYKVWQLNNRTDARVKAVTAVLLNTQVFGWTDVPAVTVNTRELERACSRQNTKFSCQKSLRFNSPCE